MEGFNVTYRVHAIQRMFERNVSATDVLEVLRHGQVVQDYPDDTPHPSKLLMGKTANRVKHVVVAENHVDKEIITITVYEPDPLKWEPGFLKKRPQ
ncbi:MAG: DUF4258 domain-containing protein [Bacteroidota bacterium]|nr:DUF4258 domain-containing protein [Bacteroidota bacterium]MDP4197139.1 DUF4258 domain-containing protein [Bacteroidota bacterium]